MSELCHREAIVNGLRFHYVEAGTGPVVLLLHGFPDFWYSWRLQIPILAAAGFHAVAPDLRGYNQSAKPSGIAQYRLDLLAEDVVVILHMMRSPRAILVGHDWGGVIAWTVARDYPDVVERLIILNAPHPAALRRELRTLSQLRKSWYAFLFQLPWLPEAAIRAWDYVLLERILRESPARKGTFTADDLAAYKAALSEPGALTAAINYYRAAARSFWRDARWLDRPIMRPTLIIWGDQDRYLGPGLLRGLDRWVPDLRVARLPDAGHWVHLEASEQVNALIMRFLLEGQPTEATPSPLG